MYHCACVSVSVRVCVALYVILNYIFATFRLKHSTNFNCSLHVAVAHIAVVVAVTDLANSCLCWLLMRLPKNKKNLFQSTQNGRLEIGINNLHSIKRVLAHLPH